MNQKNKLHHYVLVMTDEGPTFVTGEQSGTKYCLFNKTEKPKEYTKQMAQDRAIGLTLNGNLSFMVEAPYEIESQPYIYNKGKFKWIWNEESEEKND